MHKDEPNKWMFFEERDESPGIKQDKDGDVWMRDVDDMQGGQHPMDIDSAAWVCTARQIDVLTGMFRRMRIRRSRLGRL